MANTRGGGGRPISRGFRGITTPLAKIPNPKLLKHSNKKIKIE